MKRAELDSKNPPGQVDNTKALDAFAYVPKPELVIKRHTLGEYIDKTLKHEAMLDRQNKKKLTFDEWWSSPVGIALSPWGDKDDYEMFKSIWKAAQENAPSPSVPGA